MATRRKPLPAGVRDEVVREYGRSCWLRFPGCSGSRDTTMDHLYPHRLGGSDSPRNLRPACRSCNSARQDRLVQGRGIMATILLLGPYGARRPDATGSLVLDWRDMRAALGVGSDEAWPVMEGMWRGALFEALRTPSTVPLLVVPPPDTTADQVREWIRLGYRVEAWDGDGPMPDPSCELEARAWNTWRRNRLPPAELDRLSAAREADWRRFGLVF